MIVFNPFHKYFTFFLSSSLRFFSRSTRSFFFCSHSYKNSNDSKQGASKSMITVNVAKKKKKKKIQSYFLFLSQYLLTTKTIRFDGKLMFYQYYIIRIVNKLTSQANIIGLNMYFQQPINS